MKSPQPIRVLILDRYALSRAGLRMLIESHPRLQVVSEIEPREEVLQVIEEAKPDVILLNADGGGTLNLLPELSHNGVRVIVMAPKNDSKIHHEAVRQGAAGIVMKEHSVEMLLSAIEKVHGGEVWLSRSIMAALLNEMLSPSKPSDKEASPMDTLTEREQEVIQQVGLGLKNQEISERLHISESTVRHHLTSIYSKLGVTDRLELLVFAYRHKIVSLPS